MPVTLIPFESWQPDGGDHGAGLALAYNVLPVHNGWRTIDQKAVLSQVADGPPLSCFVHIWLQQSAIQKARPESDITPGIWVPSTGTSLYSMLNESAASDSSFVYAGNAPTAAQAKLQLTDMVSTAPSTDLYLRWRYKVPSTTGAWTLVIELMEGALVRATDTVTGTGDMVVFLQRQYNLTLPEATAIFDYANLSVRLTATVAGTAQSARPELDVATGGWLDQAGGGSSIFSVLDEAYPGSDADYIKSPILPAGNTAYTYSALFAVLVDPVLETGWLFRYRLRASNSGIKAILRVKQGTTVVKETTHSNLATAFAEQSMAFSAAEAAALTDFSDLTLEAAASWPGTDASTVPQISAPTVDYTNTGWLTTAGGGSYYTEIDEDPANDIDNIFGGSTLANIIELTMSPLVDPGTDADHVLRIRASTVSPGNSLIVRLYSSSTLVKQYDFGGGGSPSLTSSLATYDLALSTSEAASIASYSDLRLGLEAYGSTGGQNVVVSQALFLAPQRRWCEISFVELALPSPARAEVSWVELEAPDPTAVYRGDIPTIFMATSDHVYEVASGGFTDRTGAAWGAGSPRPGAPWFCSWGNDVIVTNRKDAVRYRAGNTGDFVDLMTSTLKPKFRFMFPVKIHLMGLDVALAGDTYDSPDAVWWSAANNSRDFDRSASTQSGAGFIRSLEGQIMGGVGGSDALVLKRGSTHVLTYTGGAVPFREDVVSPSHGTPYPRSIVKTPYGVFFWGGDTFYRLPSLPGGGYGYPEQAGSAVIDNWLTDAAYSEGAILPEEATEIALEDQAMWGWWDSAAGLLIYHYRSVQYDFGEYVLADPGGGLLLADPDGGAVLAAAYTPQQYRHHRMIVHNPRTGEWAAFLVPEGFDVSCACGLPKVQTSATHALRNSIGFSWDGTNSSWFKFNGGSTYEARLKTKRQGWIDKETGSPKSVRIKGILPVYSIKPKGASLPNVQVSIEWSNEPNYTNRYDGDGDLVSPATDTYTFQQASPDTGWFPFERVVRWVSVQVLVPEMASRMMVALRGCYVWYEEL